MDEVFDFPAIAQIGSTERQQGIIKHYTEEIFSCAGRNSERADDEIMLFVKRFANRYANYTIGDIKMFADLYIEGAFDSRYLTVNELFIAWNKYLQLRHQSEIDTEDAKHKAEREAYADEKAGDDFASEVVARIRKRIMDSMSWWDDFIASRPRGWQPTYDRNGVNVEYEQYRQQRLAAL